MTNGIVFRVKTTTTIIETGEVKEQDYTDVNEFLATLQLNVHLAGIVLNKTFTVQQPVIDGDKMEMMVVDISTDEPYMKIEGHRYMVQ